jgi:20S proteasome alpha/beta subunit
MTCIVGIVGKKGVLIAGDAQGSTDYVKRIDVSPKVFQLSDTLAVGYCGSGRFGQILQYHLMDSLEEPSLIMDEHRWVVREFIPYLREHTEQHGHLHIHRNVEEFGPSAFLLAVRGRLFTIESDFGVCEHVLPFESIGSGSETATGSMHGELGDAEEPIGDGRLLAIATRAIRAAEKLTLYVGGPITSVKTVLYTDEERELARRIIGR